MLNQYDVFSNGKTVEENRLDMAISIVEEHGYRVVKTKEELKELAIDAGFKVSEPIVVNTKIVTLKDLRNYFYMKLWEKHPENRIYTADIPWQQEMRLLRLFVESRQKYGLNKRNAIQECVAIIDTIFEHEAEFNFKRPIDITVLGQKKSAWITAQALVILNRKLYKKREQVVDELIADAERGQKVDLTKKGDELDKLLSDIEGDV